MDIGKILIQIHTQHVFPNAILSNIMLLQLTKGILPLYEIPKEVDNFKITDNFPFNVHT